MPTLGELQDECGLEAIDLSFEEFLNLVVLPKREENVFAVIVGEKSLCPNCGFAE